MLGRRALVAAMICFSIAAASCGTTATEKVTAPPAIADAEYRVGPGDQIQVYVWNRPELSVTVPVRPDGLVSTPLVENMQAAGKTPSQLARDMEKVLSEYVRSPSVNIIVTGFVGSYGDQIRVVGQAAHPQALPYRAGMTVLDVMIAVGGLGQFAAGNRAKLVRRTGDQQSEIPLRLKDLVNDGDMHANMPVRPGDVIIIPESRF
ncbi:MAG TPA: XrtA/PEP-CTERM system exopolysaccharide export protein [Steroidobacteraceae bacterium]|nr:XrtA/PEP-CTERM system exopolysaccharide export protein [Steroidobacteraceae bacterium]